MECWGLVRCGQSGRSWRVSVGYRRVRLVKAVAARLGALSYGEAWRDKAVGARCVSVLLVLVLFVQGGQGVLCSGMASYGEICSGDAFMVTVSHGV